MINDFYKFLQELDFNNITLEEKQLLKKISSVIFLNTIENTFSGGAILTADEIDMLLS